MDSFNRQSPEQKNSARKRRAPFSNGSLIVLGVVRVLGSNAVDIRAGDADVSEFPIGEVR
jgi:hypothetical protein